MFITIHLKLKHNNFNVGFKFVKVNYVKINNLYVMCNK